VGHINARVRGDAAVCVCPRERARGAVFMD